MALPGLLLAAFVSTAAAADYRLTHNTSDATSWQQGAERFAALLSEASGGAMTLGIYPNAALAGGDQMKQVALVESGEVDFVLTSAINVTPLVPEMAVFSLPYLYASYAEVDATLDGPPAERMAAIMAARGVVVLAWGENGFREVTNNVRPIRSPADLKGLRMRVAGPMYLDVMAALGAEPTQMQWSETLAALRQGTIDGQENPIGAVIVPQRVYEVQKYLTAWHYSYDPIFLGVSRTLWESWDAATQAKVAAAAREAMLYQRGLTRELTAGGIATLRQHGMEVYEPTPEELDAFAAATQPAFDTWAAKVGPELVGLFQDAIAKAAAN